MNKKALKKTLNKLHRKCIPQSNLQTINSACRHIQYRAIQWISPYTMELASLSEGTKELIHEYNKLGYQIQIEINNDYSTNKQHILDIRKERAERKNKAK